MTETMGNENCVSDYLGLYYAIVNEMAVGMTDATISDSISHNFIVQMIPHHEAAIQMSRNLLHYTKSEAMINFANNIIKTQTAGINAMRDMLLQCGTYENTADELKRYARNYDRIYRTMLTQMRSAPASSDIDADFCREMIPHHMGAIRMSQNALIFNLCPKLPPLLNSIIDERTEGVRQMQAFLKSDPSCR